MSRQSDGDLIIRDPTACQGRCYVVAHAQRPASLDVLLKRANTATQGIIRRWFVLCYTIVLICRLIDPYRYCDLYKRESHTLYVDPKTPNRPDTEDAHRWRRR